MDLGIVGGEVVTGDGRRPANVYVKDGKIAAVTTEGRTRPRRSTRAGRS
jgi:hypothetical protein